MRRGLPAQGSAGLFVSRYRLPEPRGGDRLRLARPGVPLQSQRCRPRQGLGSQHGQGQSVGGLIHESSQRKKRCRSTRTLLLGVAATTAGPLFWRLRRRGLPIGNLTSQVWANVYLTPFDHFVKRELRCPGYVRYVDDFRLFGDDWREMWEWRDRIAERLGRLRLRVHPRAQPRGVGEGVPFLGFRVWASRRRVKARKVHHAGRRLRRVAGQVRDGSMPPAKLTEAVVAWVNHVSRANTIGLRKSVLRGFRRDDF